MNKMRWNIFCTYIIRVSLLAGLATALSGCALALGGAVVGSLVSTDRRTPGIQLEDQTIEIRAVNLIKEAIRDRGQIGATSYNRILLLTGTVPKEADRQSVENNLKKLDNVRQVVNEIAIGPDNTLAGLSSDAVVTSKVKATFIETKDLMAPTIKVVTERGIVYLMGRVTEREANRAASVASTVSGVRKVIKAFDVITEQELSRL
jgi:osmotically-inducible protein OsmY